MFHLEIEGPSRPNGHIHAVGSKNSELHICGSKDISRRTDVLVRMKLGNCG
jgi:hypothetical protein